MNFNSLRQAIDIAVMTITFDSENVEADRVICGCLLYETATTILASNSAYANNISQLVMSYLPTMKNITADLKGKYVSYKNMVDYIRNNFLSSFKVIREYHIRDLLRMYNDKRLITPFSTVMFSPEMYNVQRTTFKEEVFLSAVHTKVMIPIFKYYNRGYGKTENDITVENVLTESPGKVIKVAIADISPTKMMTDIKLKRMGNLMGEYIYSLKVTSDRFLEITIK